MVLQSPRQLEWWVIKRSNRTEWSTKNVMMRCLEEQCDGKLRHRSFATQIYNKYNFWMDVPSITSFNFLLHFFHVQSTLLLSYSSTFQCANMSYYIKYHWLNWLNSSLSRERDWTRWNSFHLVPASKQVAVSVWHKPVAVCTALNSWWWTERPSETRTALRKNK
jgi:hypothetical protein